MGAIRLTSLILFLFAVQSVSATTLTETYKKRIAFESGSLLRLTNSNGEIEISTWDEEEIDIIAHKRVKASGSDRAEKLMERLEIVISERGGEVEIETKSPGSRSGGGFFNWLFGGGHVSYSVSYEIRVPREADLDVETTNGEVSLRGVDGRIILKSTNGKITGRDVSGLVKCKTTNGSIKMSMNSVRDKDEMSFKTTNGSIRLYLPQEFGGDVDLSTTNGHVESDFPLSSSRHKKKRRVRGYIEGGNCELYCATTNGSIYLMYND